MPKITTPPGTQLPAFRVEPELYEALANIAREQGRTLTDVVRSFLREQDHAPLVRLPPVRVEAVLVRELFNLANKEGRSVSDVARSRLRARVNKHREAK